MQKHLADIDIDCYGDTMQNLLENSSVSILVWSVWMNFAVMNMTVWDE